MSLPLPWGLPCCPMRLFFSMDCCRTGWIVWRPAGLVAGLDRLRSGTLVACIGIAVILLGRRHDDAAGSWSEGGENLARPSPPRLPGRSTGGSESRHRGRVYCLNQCRARPPGAAGAGQGNSRLVDDHPGCRPDLNSAVAPSSLADRQCH